MYSLGTGIIIPYGIMCSQKMYQSIFVTRTGDSYGKVIKYNKKESKTVIRIRYPPQKPDDMQQQSSIYPFTIPVAVTQLRKLVKQGLESGTSFETWRTISRSAELFWEMTSCFEKCRPLSKNAKIFREWRDISKNAKLFWWILTFF